MIWILATWRVTKAANVREWGCSGVIVEMNRKCGKSVPQILLVRGVQSGWSILPKSVCEEQLRAIFEVLKG